jgi:hypothetical protein
MESLFHRPIDGTLTALVFLEQLGRNSIENPTDN